MEQEITLKLKVSEIQLLNSIVSTSIPNAPFATVTNFVTNISQQIQGQLRELEAKENEGAVQVDSQD